MKRQGHTRYLRRVGGEFSALTTADAKGDVGYETTTALQAKISIKIRWRQGNEGSR